MLVIKYPCIALLFMILQRSKCAILDNGRKLGQTICQRVAIAGIATCSVLQLGQPSPSEASILDKLKHIKVLNPRSVQSKGWELARQKRSAAIKAMQLRGILKVDTDEIGNQFLSLPWIPDRKLPYKSLSLHQRLVNEVCAGALGEISKDALLYAVDTAKTRRQAQGGNKKKDSAPDTISHPHSNSHKHDAEHRNETHTTHIWIATSAEGDGADSLQEGPITDCQTDKTDRTPSTVRNFLALYAGFPIVALASVPQGGSFFFVRKGLVEIFSTQFPTAPEVVSASVPIILGVMVYWLFRTPAEVIKTQVQTGQYDSIRSALTATVGGSIQLPAQPAEVHIPGTIESSVTARTCDSSGGGGVLTLWRRYPVMLSLDIPFQLINFVLYGWLSEAAFGPHGALHWEQTVWTRLVCGVLCGMVSAAVTCPLDVCKTRIIAREKNSAVDMGGATLVPSSLNATQTSAQPTEKEARTTSNANNVALELARIVRTEGVGALFLGLGQRLVYTGLANGIRLAAYGTSRMDLMMRSLDRL